MKSQRENFNSGVVNEILTEVPHWLLQWGSTIVFAILVGAFAMAYFIRYPEIIQGEVIVTTLIPPANIIAYNSGRISKLFVKDNQKVNQDDVLGLIDNTANYDDLIKLKALLNKLRIYIDNGTLPPNVFEQNLQLGDMQDKYHRLIKDYNNYRLFQLSHPQLQQIAIEKKQLEQYKNLLRRKNIQESLFQSTFDLIKKDFLRNEGLYNDGVIAAKEFEEHYQKYLQAKSNLEDFKIDIIKTTIIIADIEKRMLSLHDDNLQQNSLGLLTLNESIEALDNIIDSWMHNYVLKSPISGKISFFDFWALNQNVKAGEVVFTIIPDDSSLCIGRVIMPLQNSGKVMPGQKVLIRLYNLPAEEYGMLEARVSSISTVSKNDVYMLIVEFPRGLKSTFGKELVFTQEMKGKAQIVTKELSLLERFFYKSTKVFTNN